MFPGSKTLAVVIPEFFCRKSTCTSEQYSAQHRLIRPSEPNLRLVAMPAQAKNSCSMVLGAANMPRGALLTHTSGNGLPGR